jgi:hypothetical protein
MPATCGKSSISSARSSIDWVAFSERQRHRDDDHDHAQHHGGERRRRRANITTKDRRQAVHTGSGHHVITATRCEPSTMEMWNPGILPPETRPVLVNFDHRGAVVPRIIVSSPSGPRSSSVMRTPSSRSCLNRNGAAAMQRRRFKHVRRLYRRRSKRGRCHERTTLPRVCRDTLALPHRHSCHCSVHVERPPQCR